jgi:hypothetical protein
MSHEHHRCECKHERVRYCAKCQVCHCLDCAQEWRTYPTYGYTYTNAYGYPYGTVLCGSATSAGRSISGGSVSSGSYNSASVTPTGCNHL